MSRDARSLLRSCCRRAAEGGDCSCAPPATSQAAWVTLPGKGPPASLQARLQLQATRPLSSGNRVRLLLDGTESYGAMLALVEEARREIFFENFIFRGDAVGRAFADALRRRAEEGLEVRVLHDPFGALMSKRAPIGFRFHRSPVWVRAYNPPRPSPAFFRDGRDHRKLVVVDRASAVVGGMCLADVWMGNCVERCTWRDSAVGLEGPAAAELAEEFERMWRRGWRLTPRGGGHPAEPEIRPPWPEPRGHVRVRVVADEPRTRRTERLLAEALANARQEALLVTPYLIPTRRLASALRDAAGRGVDVQIIVPLRGNHRVVALAMGETVGELLAAGVRIWRWTGPLIHAKTAVVDRLWSLVGSTNLDPLSLRRNAELNVEVHGEAFASQLRDSFERDRLTSVPWKVQDLHSRPRLRKLLSRVALLGRPWQ